jgi:hypothetical protein
MNYLNLVIDPLNQELVQSRGNTIIGVNPIVTKNNTIVTMHIDDEECGSKRLAPYGELHGYDAFGFHQVAPTPLIDILFFTSSSSSLPSFLKIEYNI